MEKFIQFIINHWLWWLGLVIVLLLIIYEELKDRLHGVQRITPQHLVKMYNNDEVAMVDVRDRKAYEQGHIIGSTSAPVSELDSHVNRFEKFKNKTLVIVDDAGQSIKIAIKLRSQGFKTAILAGGLNAWTSAGLPLSK